MPLHVVKIFTSFDERLPWGLFEAFDFSQGGPLLFHALPQFQRLFFFEEPK